MHPAVLAPQSAAMVPYPVFGSPVGLRQLDYHPMMFPFPHQLAMHAQAGAFQYALAGIPFQPHHQNMLSDRSPKSAKDSHSPGQTRHSFTIDAILNSKEKTRDSSSPDNSPVCRKISASNRRHERMKALSLPYSRSPQRGGDFGEPVSHTNLHSGLHETDEKSGRGGEWKGSRSKRIRTIFTPEQLERLEAEFERQQYMVGTERYYLATELSLTEAQVKVWFQNRRIKWRKQTLEKQQAQLAASDVYRGLDSDSEDDRTSSGADRETAELSARRESAGEVSADMDSARELTANRNSAGEISPDTEVRTSQCFSNELCSTRNIQLPKSPSND